MFRMPLRARLRDFVALLCCAAFALILLAPANAVAGDEDKKKRDGFDFGTKDKPGKKGRTSPRDPKGPEAEGEQDPIAREIALLRRWPARSAQLAAEALFLRGAEAVPYLVLALKQGDPAVQPGAATVLGRIGEEVHVGVILGAAAKRPNGHRADDFFRAAYNLSPARTKRWLIGFLPLSDRPIFRSLAAKFLAEKVTVDDRDRILNLLESRKASVREAGLGLLRPAKVEDADARLLQALSDISPGVAKRAAVLLAIDPTAEQTQAVNALAREGDSRERAYATLALVEGTRIGGTSAFEPATLAEISGRRGLLHPDKLSRASAAVGMAYGALDTKDDALTALLDSTVVDVLIDTVGGDHFRDYESLREPAFAALKRLSGRVDIPDNAVAWARWWMVSKGTFRASRPLTGITPTDLPSAYVRFEAIEADGRRSWAEFIAVDGRARKDAFLLTNDVFGALVDALDHAGIFDAEERAQPRADEHVRVMLGVGDQRKTMVLVPSGRDMRYMQVKMRFSSLLDANVWQRYRDTDKSSDARSWWDQNAKMMAEAAPDERRIMLQTAIVYAFDDLQDDDARQEAYYRLEDMGARLTKAQQKDLASSITSGAAFGTFEARAMRWIVAQAPTEVRDPLIEAVAARLEPEAQSILAELIAEGGLARIDQAFSDPRAGMRAAACRAARRIIARPETANVSVDDLAALSDKLKPGLEVLALDDEPQVAVEAVLGLAYLGDSSVVSRLEKLYKTGNLATKLKVTEALGTLPGEDGHPLLTYILSEERGAGAGRLRSAALEAMARSDHPSAVRLLSFYLLNDPDSSVRDAAGRALVDLGTTDARFAVIDPLVRGDVEGEQKATLLTVLSGFEGDVVGSMLQRNLTDKDIRVVAAAAIGAANHNLSRAVPALIHLLRKGEGSDKEAALRALQTLTSRRLRASGYGNAAELYGQWFETNGSGDFRRWFREALKDEGYDVGPLNAWLQGKSDDAAVPLLVRVLRDPDPVLRRNAAIALRDATGRSFGTVERATSARDAAAIADLWSRWWQQEQAGKAGR
ncbi:MAG: hypothetical protein QNJ98_18440 [Planctomycetota bacterium]|nr:hypothetical protein [Planctomycetota bacterium]